MSRFYEIKPLKWKFEGEGTKNDHWRTKCFMGAMIVQLEDDGWEVSFTTDQEFDPGEHPEEQNRWWVVEKKFKTPEQAKAAADTYYRRQLNRHLKKV